MVESVDCSGLQGSLEHEQTYELVPNPMFISEWNVRFAPDQGAPIVGTIHVGESFVGVDNRDGWLRVTSREGIRGFALQAIDGFEYLRKVGQKGKNLDLPQDHAESIDRDGIPRLIQQYVHEFRTPEEQILSVLAANPELQKLANKRMEQLEPSEQIALIEAIAEETAKEALNVPRPLALNEIDAMRKSTSNDLLRVAVLDVAGSTTHKSMAEAVRTHGERIAIIDLLSGTDIARGKLAAFDVVLAPGGDHFAMLDSIMSSGQVHLREFVRAGGGFVGACGGAFLAEWLGISPVYNVATNKSRHGIHGRMRAQLPLPEAFSTVFSAAASNAFVAGGGLQFDTPPLMMPVPVGTTGASVLLSIANDGVLEDQRLDEHNVRDRYHQIEGRMPQSCGVLANEYGCGRVILFSGHPENSGCDEVTGYQWGNLLAEAVAYVARDQPSEGERLACYAAHVNTCFVNGQVVEQCRHGFYRFKGQPQCLQERSDSNKFAFDSVAAQRLLLEANPRCRNVDELLARHTISEEKVDLRSAMLDVLFPRVQDVS